VGDETPEDRERAKQKELERRLDSGVTELPRNRPRGMLGEHGVDLRKVDDLDNLPPDLNAGISQEIDLPVVWLAILVSYVVIFPLAFVILWRSRQISRRAKIVTSIVFAIGIVVFAIWWIWVRA
jgi:hypothetical protein